MQVDEDILTRIREAAALYLWKIGAVKVNVAEPFKLASGNFSPIYVNCRQVLSEPAFMGLFTAGARLMMETGGIEPDAIAGGETAGIPLAAYLANALGLSMRYVRKLKKGYGLASLVEGGSVQGLRVILVEDLITDAGSKLHFIEALRAAGAEVDSVLVLFDRQQGGAEALQRQGVRLLSLTDLGTVLDLAGSAGGIGSGDLDQVRVYLGDPRAFHVSRGLEYHESTA